MPVLPHQRRGEGDRVGGPRDQRRGRGETELLPVGHRGPERLPVEQDRPAVDRGGVDQGAEGHLDVGAHRDTARSGARMPPGDRESRPSPLPVRRVGPAHRIAPPEEEGEGEAGAGEGTHTLWYRPQRGEGRGEKPSPPPPRRCPNPRPHTEFHGPPRPPAPPPGRPAPGWRGTDPPDAGPLRREVVPDFF